MGADSDPGTLGIQGKTDWEDDDDGQETSACVAIFSAASQAVDKLWKNCTHCQLNRDHAGL